MATDVASNAARYDGVSHQPSLLARGGCRAVPLESDHRTRRARLEAVDDVRFAKKMNSHFLATVVYALEHVRNEFAFEPYRLGTDLIRQPEWFLS